MYKITVEENGKIIETLESNAVSLTAVLSSCNTCKKECKLNKCDGHKVKTMLCAEANLMELDALRRASIDNIEQLKAQLRNVIMKYTADAIMKNKPECIEVLMEMIKNC